MKPKRKRSRPNRAEPVVYSSDLSGNEQKRSAKIIDTGKGRTSLRSLVIGSLRGREERSGGEAAEDAGGPVVRRRERVNMGVAGPRSGPQGQCEMPILEIDDGAGEWRW